MSLSGEIKKLLDLGDHEQEEAWGERVTVDGRSAGVFLRRWKAGMRWSLAAGCARCKRPCACGEEH